MSCSARRILRPRPHRPREGARGAVRRGPGARDDRPRRTDRGVRAAGRVAAARCPASRSPAVGPARWSTLARQNFYVRYRRASLGVLWAVGFPLMQAFVLAFVFSAGDEDQRGAPLRRVHPGRDHARGTTSAPACRERRRRSSRTRRSPPASTFPGSCSRWSSSAANLYGFILSLVVARRCASVIDGIGIRPAILWLVPATAFSSALTTGFSIVFAGLHVYFRDMRYFVQAAFMAWLYATPVIYSVAQAQRFAALLPFNPVDRRRAALPRRHLREGRALRR